MPKNIYLSVVIPALNERSRLPGTLHEVGDYLAAQPYDSEVLVIDDGSTDGTADAVRTCSMDRPVQLLQHQDGANHGKGAAVRLGMLEARGAFRITMDADNSTTLDQIIGLWPWFDQGYDIAIGSRRAPGSRIEIHQSWIKELAGHLGNCVIRALVIPGIADTQAGFKMFTSRAAQAIFPRQTIDRWGFDIEILAIARQLGYLIREVPIVWHNAPGSKVRAGSYLDVLADVWRIRRNIKSGRYLRFM